MKGPRNRREHSADKPQQAPCLRDNFRLDRTPERPTQKGQPHAHYRETSAQKEGSKRTQAQDPGCQEMQEQGLGNPRGNCPQHQPWMKERRRDKEENQIFLNDPPNPQEAAARGRSSWPPRGPEGSRGGGVREGQGSQRGAWAVGQHAGWGDVAQMDSRLRLNTQRRGDSATETLKRKPGLLKKAINGE